jgi:hypothetical protein
MLNWTIMGLILCCFLLAVITVFATYFANKTIFENNKGAATGLWIGCIFLTFMVIISFFGTNKCPELDYSE